MEAPINTNIYFYIANIFPMFPNHKIFSNNGHKKKITKTCLFISENKTHLSQSTLLKVLLLCFTIYKNPSTGTIWTKAYSSIYQNDVVQQVSQSAGTYTTQPQGGATAGSFCADHNNQHLNIYLFTLLQRRHTERRVNRSFPVCG